LDGAHGISTNRTLYIDAMLKRAEGVRFDRDRNFRRIVRDFDTIADADYTAPDGLDEVLRPYHDEGFKWLTNLGRLGFVGILADDMGLGKTLELISYLAF
jgi:SNF2 family DNA or RNA helicase